MLNLESPTKTSCMVDSSDGSDMEDSIDEDLPLLSLLLKQSLPPSPTLVSDSDADTELTKVSGLISKAISTIAKTTNVSCQI